MNIKLSNFICTNNLKCEGMYSRQTFNNLFDKAFLNFFKFSYNYSQTSHKFHPRLLFITSQKLLNLVGLLFLESWSKILTKKINIFRLDLTDSTISYACMRLIKRLQTLFLFGQIHLATFNAVLPFINKLINNSSLH